MDRRVVARILLALLLVAGLGYTGFVSYVSWKSAESLVHPDREAVTFLPSDVGVGFENVSFTTSDAFNLVGWWMPAQNATGSVVVLHGYAESKNQSLKYVPFLHNASFNVLAFDFRAHGQSDGDHTTVGVDEVRDVRAAVDYAEGRAASPVALLGFSMGAATAINAAAQMGDVRAVVSDSSFASLQNIAANSITHFTHLPKHPYGPMAVWFAQRIVHEDISKNRPVDSVRDVRVPLLVIQGGKDDIAIARDDGERIHAADPASEYWLVPEAAHVKAHDVAKAEYETRVVAFLARALA